MLDMQKTLALLTIFYSCCCLVVSAKESRYEQMKKTLNKNSLSLINLIVDTLAINKASYVPGMIEITDYQRRTDPNAETTCYHCKVRIRGGMASTLDKKSFAIKLLDDFGKDKEVNVLGIREENSWILDAMAVDRIRMRNRVCFDIWNEMNHTPYETKYENRNGTKGVFVEVYINGDYNGLYCLTDKIDRKLLGLKKAKVNDDGEITVRGLLYKGYTWNGYTDIWLLSYTQADTDKKKWNGWELQYPDDYPSVSTWQPLMDLIDFCSDSTTNETFIQSYQDFFYTENLADYAIFTMAMNVGDNAYKNTFLSVANITEGHRYMLSPWDMDGSLGNRWNGKYDESLASINRYNSIAPFNRLVVQNIDGFRDLLAKKWAEYHASLFSPENIGRRLDDYAELFISSGAWEREFSKWNGNPVPLKENIADELEYVKNWYARNYKSLYTQFETVDITNMTSRHPENVIYGIDGRRVNGKNMTKGIYIVNNRKVLIK